MREDQATAELFLYRRLGKRVVVCAGDTKDKGTIHFGIVEYTTMTRTGGRGKWRRVWHATYEDGEGDDLNRSQLLDAFRIYGIWAAENDVLPGTKSSLTERIDRLEQVFSSVGKEVVVVTEDGTLLRAGVSTARVV